MLTMGTTKAEPSTYRDAIQTANSRPTLDEIAHAKPQRGSGAPSRTRSHYAAILQLLRERAEQGLGVLGSELYARPDLYGRSPRNRISEARGAGHLIEGKPHGNADWFYRLIRENSTPVERPQAKPIVADWKDRHRITGLPLFDSAAVR
jgi:hypothetical protein